MARVRAAQGRETIERERREAAIITALKDINLGDLKRKEIAVDIGIKQPNGTTVVTLSKEDLIFAMLALKDHGGSKPEAWHGSRGAYIAGNFLDASERTHTDKAGAFTMGDGALSDLCYRVERAIQKSIADNLGAKERVLAGAMAADWATEFDRLRGAMIEHFNQEVARVEHSVPLRRQDMDYSSFEGQLLDEVKTWAGLTTKPDQGSTIERIKIGVRHQLPVKTNVVDLYFDSVRKQEHLIAFADYFKTANRVFKGRGRIAKTVLHELRMTHGEGAVKYAQKYLAELANPRQFQQLSNGEKAWRFLAGNQAVAYLGLRGSGKRAGNLGPPCFRELDEASVAQERREHPLQVCCMVSCRTWVGSKPSSRKVSWTQRPMARAEITVPAPTMPPRSQPIRTAATSMPPRQRPIERPVFLLRATMRPSLGPAPKPEPM
ncbi:MAG: hypothetical protein WCQ50_21545 [Spirochaetota bacterium]